MNRIFLILAMVWPGFVAARTVLLVHFDAGLNPDFSASATNALVNHRNRPGDITLVEGRFGKGARVERGAPSFALAYEIGKSLQGEGGTVEFWYRPEWDTATVCGPEEKSEYLRGRPISVTLFATGESCGGIWLGKNQYNVFNFTVSRNYRSICDVMIPVQYVFGKSNEWTHVAVSWDRYEARLFANGKLVAVADEWDLNYFDTAISLGTISAGAGTFDDLRISDTKRYIGAFPVPNRPLTVEGRGTESGGQRPDTGSRTPEAGSRRMEGGKTNLDMRPVSSAVGRTTFYICFTNSLTAQIAGGAPVGWANRPPLIEDLDEIAYLRLCRYTNSVGYNLAFELRNNLHPALGRVRLVVRFAEPVRLPAVLFDSSYVADWSGMRTGIRLIVTTNACLEWQCVGDNRVLDAVQSSPLSLPTDRDSEFGFAWAGSTIALYEGERELAYRQGCAIPTRLDSYFFIGSDSSGRDTLDGWIREVTVMKEWRP